VSSDGTGPRFRLRGWRDARAAAFERLSDDAAGLRALTAGLLGEGYVRLDLEAWNLELNDWVRLERFEAD
jgi:hypothetical protein